MSEDKLPDDDALDAEGGEVFEAWWANMPPSIRDAEQIRSGIKDAVRFGFVAGWTGAILADRQAYGDARAREAIEQAAAAVQSIVSKSAQEQVAFNVATRIIRALLPKKEEDKRRRRS